MALIRAINVGGWACLVATVSGCAAERAWTVTADPSQVTAQPLDPASSRRIEPTSEVKHAQFEVVPPGTPTRAPTPPATSFPRVAPPGRRVNGPESLPIDLPTALRLANADNLQIAFAREQIRQALARVEQAKSLW